MKHKPLRPGTIVIYLLLFLLLLRFFLLLPLEIVVERENIRNRETDERRDAEGTEVNPAGSRNRFTSLF